MIQENVSGPAWKSVGHFPRECTAVPLQQRCPGKASGYHDVLEREAQQGTLLNESWLREMPSQGKLGSVGLMPLLNSERGGQLKTR
jgi:hypothetical protein